MRTLKVVAMYAVVIAVIVLIAFLPFLVGALPKVP